GRPFAPGSSRRGACEGHKQERSHPPFRPVALLLWWTSTPDTDPGLFDRIVALTIEWEGPSTNDPGDAGGPTIFGIATRYHPGFDGTLEGARLIYRRDYWAPIHGDELPPALALVVFDASVVPGLGWAAIALQRLVHVDHDGVV